jgi:hypothetical protein
VLLLLLLLLLPLLLIEDGGCRSNCQFVLRAAPSLREAVRDVPVPTPAAAAADADAAAVHVLAAGDEVADTHFGNNNWYGHDTKLSWMAWPGTTRAACWDGLVVSEAS